MKAWLLGTALAAAAWGGAPLVPVLAGEIPFSKFMYLEEGMTEGEVLLRVGAPDHEEVVESRFGGIDRHIWYYIPESTRGWITTVQFNAAGKVVRIDRDRRP